MVLITLENVTKIYNGRKVIDDLSFVFPQKGVVPVTGPSGSGKTTLIRLLTGLCKPDCGVIKGLEQAKISCVFQEDRLLPWFSLRENVALVCPKQKMLCEKWIAAMELTEAAEQYPDTLSGGMQRRCALARAMVRAEGAGCNVLILDEPFKGLDDALKKRILKRIQDASKDMLVIFITHDREELSLIQSSGGELRITGQTDL